MPERSRDWKAQVDLRHARNSRDLGDYEWAAFASHQAAEKAIKAAYQKLHLEASGHVLTELLKGLAQNVRVQADCERETARHELHPKSVAKWI
jgi:HEPN domain-containing protein